MDYKRRFLLGGSKQKVQQHQQYPMPELGRALSAPLASTATTAPLGSLTTAGSCHHAMPHTTPIADIQQGISKYLDALNVFCRASTFLTDLFSTVFRNSHYSKAATQLKDVQEHVMEAASRLTSAIKPEIAKMLMELSAGAANFTDQKEFSLQDIEVEYLLCHTCVGKYTTKVSENIVLSFFQITVIVAFVLLLLVLCLRKKFVRARF